MTCDSHKKTDEKLAIKLGRSSCNLANSNLMENKKDELISGIIRNNIVLRIFIQFGGGYIIHKTSISNS